MTPTIYCAVVQCQQTKKHGNMNIWSGQQTKKHGNMNIWSGQNKLVIIIATFKSLSTFVTRSIIKKS